tara:strand:- start:30 stop:770 length:741 start_codon:yes stop_codon:yes gene_type:complete
MASGPNTEKLIVTFQEKAKKAAKDKIEVDECQKGFEIKDSEDNIVAKIENLEEVINRFDPITQGLDDRILTLNLPVSNAQTELFNLYTGATQAGCSTFVDDNTPVVDVRRDVVTLYNYDYTDTSYTGEDPFNESNYALTASNLGIATHTAIATVSIGTFYGFTGAGVTCVSYASSISAKNSEISSLQTPRDAVITPINEIKEARSDYQLQRYGYKKTQFELDADIATANLIVQTLQNPDLAQFIRE